MGEFLKKFGWLCSTIEILEGKIRAQVETFIVKNYASKKHFFCSQFVAWTIQLSVAVLHEMDPDRFPLNIVDVLPIRDTKAIPARLANLLTKSQHFVEFKSEESMSLFKNERGIML